MVLHHHLLNFSLHDKIHFSLNLSLKMTRLILFTIFSLINFCNTEHCGIVKQVDSEGTFDWPWTVSLFYETSSEALCEGTLISSKHILTGM